MKRRFAIGTVDGVTHYSDWVADDVLQSFLDENDGVIGEDPRTGNPVRVDSPEEAMEFMSDFLKIDEKMNTQVFNMEIVGTQRRFNVRHIIWWQIEAVHPDQCD